MPESHNYVTLIPPLIRSQWYTTYDIFEWKTCVEDRNHREQRIQAHQYCTHPTLLRNLKEIRNNAIDMTHWQDNKAHTIPRPGETTWVLEPTHGREEPNMPPACLSLRSWSVKDSKRYSGQSFCPNAGYMHCSRALFCINDSVSVDEWSWHDGQHACCADVNTRCALRRHNQSCLERLKWD